MRCDVLALLGFDFEAAAAVMSEAADFPLLVLRLWGFALSSEAFFLPGLLKETGFTSIFGISDSGDGLDMLKYIVAAFVVPKSRFEPDCCTLLKASRNMAL